MALKKENRRNIFFRYGVIVFFILMLSLRIVYKLADNTVFSADKWNALADSTLSEVVPIIPVRGNIIAADGSVLATNMIVYTPCIDYQVPNFDEKRYKKSIAALTDSLAKYFPRRTRDEWKAHLEAPMEKAKKKRPRAYTIARDVSYDESQLIASFPFFCEKKRFTGFHVKDRLTRVRPYGEMARRSIGAIGVTNNNPEPHGVYGLERSLDSLLRGTPGYSKKVSLTSAIVDWTDQPAVDGYDVLTTIDIKMQDIIENELNNVLEVSKAAWGSAILMEVGTGDIKAIANLELSPKAGEGYIESLNYAVTRFEPGSVVKTLSLMVAMEDGKVPNLDKIYTTGPSFVVGGCSTTDCTKSTELPLRRALEYSSNIVMSKMILEAYGDCPGKFYTRIKETGFLEPIHSGIAGEMVPKIDSLGLDRVSLTRQAFGYCTEISPLYTCALYNAIAGGGRFVRPRLVRGLRSNGVDSIFDVTYIRDRICSENTARELRGMLRQVVWGDRGTARRVVRSDKVEIAGKTGTAKMIPKGSNTYADGVNRLSFCGFFPYDNPRYTCMVVVAYPKETWMSPESTSGRVVKNMAEAMYARGMLGNHSDFTKAADGKQGSMPTYYASLDKREQRLHGRIASGNSAVLSSGKPAKSGVPNVMGLGLRDAIHQLESAGYNVTFSGSGYVSAQNPTAGAAVSRGQKIHLVLHE